MKPTCRHSWTDAFDPLRSPPTQANRNVASKPLDRAVAADQSRRLCNHQSAYTLQFEASLHSLTLALFPPVHGKIERGEPLLIAGPLERLGKHPL